MSVLYLALAYLKFHRWRSLVLVLVSALILTVPMAVNQILEETQSQLTARADATPLLIGAKGSALDLAMNALYFTEDRPPLTTLQTSEDVWDSELADSIPLYVRYASQGAPIVGTSLDYFDFRGMELAEGEPLTVLGDAVLGAGAATRLGLSVGDYVISTPENLFDLAGVYPLRMPVTGILAPSGTPDDEAIFVDVKTTWVIEGIGHGHENVLGADAVVDQSVIANAAIEQFVEITEANIDSFHFHGDPAGFPLSAVIAVPPDHKSETILRGRYLGDDAAAQIIQPRVVIRRLMDSLFRIKDVLDTVLLIVSGAALMAIALALYLSWQLRRREAMTVFKLGGQSLFMTQLVLAEVVILLSLSLAIAFAAARLFAVVAAPYLNALTGI